MTLENLIGKGLQREPASAEEIHRFLARIIHQLGGCPKGTISLDSRFDLAYEALLQIGLVALRANNLRPDSRGGHHILALQTLNTSIGYPREKLRLLDEYRRQRAIGLYDGSFEPTQAEFNELLATVLELMEHLQTWLNKCHPELA
jgi:hypothetical protein